MSKFPLTTLGAEMLRQELHRLKTVERGSVFVPSHAVRRQPGNEDRNVLLFRQADEPAHMIGMLMSDQDGV